jgi:acetyltransferase-like isoleucine patch superfamily enzyme
MAVYIHPTAEVHPNAKIGDGTRIWNNAQVRERAVIGKNCIISKDVYVDLDTSIGDGVKIQNGVSIYKGVTVEDEVFIGPYAVFTNDLFPRANVKTWEIMPTRLQKGCSIGANSTIVCGVTVGNYAMVAAGAVVTTNVPRYTLVAGNPARNVGCVCHCGARMKHDEVTLEMSVFECPSCGSQLKFSAMMTPFEGDLMAFPDRPTKKAA